jgi:hypothetical protein
VWQEINRRSEARTLADTGRDEIRNGFRLLLIGVVALPFSIFLCMGKMVFSERFSPVLFFVGIGLILSGLRKRLKGEKRLASPSILDDQPDQSSKPPVDPTSPSHP